MCFSLVCVCEYGSAPLSISRLIYIFWSCNSTEFISIFFSRWFFSQFVWCDFLRYHSILSVYWISMLYISRSFSISQEMNNHKKEVSRNNSKARCLFFRRFVIFNPVFVRSFLLSFSLRWVFFSFLVLVRSQMIIILNSSHTDRSIRFISLAHLIPIRCVYLSFVYV